MVVIARPGASSASTRQALTGAPSISTVQVPQLPLLQPSLVPVRPSRSRSSSSSVSRVSASTVRSSPLTVQVSSVFMRASIPASSDRQQSASARAVSTATSERR